MNLFELLVLVAVVVAVLLLAIYIRLGRIYTFMKAQRSKETATRGGSISPPS